MSTILLVKNIPSRWPTGSVIEAFPSTHQFGRLEDKRVFDANNPNGETWPRFFILLHIPDLEPLSLQVYDLIRVNSKTNLPTKRLIPQGQESPFYADLVNNAYVSAPWAVVSQLIEDIV